tara:strand:- start:558 stop:704 length:147 start_codon:yes stop_codon:yes gene_type:complete
MSIIAEKQSQHRLSLLGFMFIKKFLKREPRLEKEKNISKQRLADDGEK